MKKISAKQRGKFDNILQNSSVEAQQGVINLAEKVELKSYAILRAVKPGKFTKQI